MTEQIIRYVGADGVHVGVRTFEGIRRLAVGSVAELLMRPLAEIGSIVERGTPEPGRDVRLLPPIDGHTEVWASGVTYQRSSQARQEESQIADVYERIYQAQRPELFFKSAAWRVCGHGEPIGVRSDSRIDVPEPELALVCNANAELVGVTVCDDVSSRSIEGENPLYLPQAKIYSGSCAVGPGIVPAWHIPDLYTLEIAMSVRRDGATAWSGRTSTALLNRRFDELIEHLFRNASFPEGVVLSSGTGLVPELDFTLRPGDEVTVEVADVGTLTNPVRPAEDFGWLTPALDRVPS